MTRKMTFLGRALVALLMAVVALAGCLPQAGGTQQGGMKVLPELQGQGLTGRLIFVHSREEGPQVVQLDLATGAVKALFSAPKGALLEGLALSPTNGHLALAYAPEGGEEGLTDIYSTADGSDAPQEWLKRSGAKESYQHPTWSPDGQWLYYTHVVSAPQTVSGRAWQIERVAVTGGTPEVLLTDAMWPRLSPDGTKLAYLSVVPNTSNNELMLANADGANPMALLPPRKYPAVDDHLFTPDGQRILFSTLNEHEESAVPAQPRWTFGVGVVYAHDEPSDWFRVAVTGGEGEQVTKLKQVGLYAAFAPSGDKVAFVSQQGVYVMNADGSGLAQIASGAAGAGLAWVK